jgi:acetylornithine deacetylase/succinyl-diaminopimelate desuccinylase-like protein
MDDAAINREAIELTRELIRIDTSNPPGRERQAAEHLARYLAANGVEVEIAANDPERPNVIGRIRGTGDGPSLAICGHTDVVPAKEANWTHPPFAAHVDDEGYLWGRGAVDMKNETATRAVTIASLAREGFRPRGDLLFIAQSDEEDGESNCGMRWLVEARPDLRVDYALDEGGGQRLVLPDGRVLIAIECGQKATLPVSVTALGEAGHASKPYVGANAVPRLATLVSRIAAYAPERRLLEPVRLMIELIAGPLTGDLGADVARACAQHPWVASTLPALLGTTMAPTRLSGSGARNVMPARAVAEIDCRVLPGTVHADLERELRAALGDDLPYELAWLDQLTGGALSPHDSPLFAACQEWADVADPGATLLPVISTGFADSNYLRERWGTIAHGFWPFRTTPVEIHTAGFHDRDERLHVDDLGYATRAHLAIVRTLLG